MGITSTVTIDSVAGTASLSISTGSTIIESVVYTNSSQQIAFNTRGAITLSISDFLTQLNLFAKFNQTIQSAPFSPFSSNRTIPNTNVVITDDGISQLAWTYTSGNHPLIDYNCSYPSGVVTINKRNQSIMISSADWLYFMYCMSNYISYVTAVYRR